MMSIWKNSICDIYYRSGGNDLDDTGYEIRITDNELVISYENEAGWVNYKGMDLGHGHYLLTAPAVNGRAFIHHLENSDILEGSWEEDGEQGMWRIHLLP